MANSITFTMNANKTAACTWYSTDPSYACHESVGIGVVRAIETYPEMIKLVRRIKVLYGLKIVVVNNEARETEFAPISNTPMFVQIAESLGIRSILHTDYRSTCAKLASFGLQNDEGIIHETG